MRRVLALLALVAALTLSLFVTAAAADDLYPAPTEPAPVSVAPGVQVLGEQVQRSPSTSLPFTGADVVELVMIGAGAVVVGGGLVRLRRRTA